MTPPVAYPGPPGTHTAAAAAALFPSGPHVPVTGFRGVADAVLAAEVAYGVLPIESSLAGAVAETHDLLYERALSIVGETILPVTHCLAAAGPLPLEEIRTVHSHPTALEQCRDLLERLPGARVVPAATTAEAARHVAESGDLNAAAIASAEAARLNGLTPLLDDVGDGVAFTRFVSVAPFTRLARGGDAPRTAFTFATDHRPGALFAAIEPFARAGLDLVRLVSRPLPATPWRYRFDAVVAGHPLDPAVRLALRELAAQAESLRVVGVYDGHPEEAA
ncbi:MAG TPA: prephenate dehydratase domain-containing protein [Gaiellaceae bacterium]|nr:prephenate dehydratase domain-containing protein [Gaiellaceae bacterium]